MKQDIYLDFTYWYRCHHSVVSVPVGHIRALCQTAENIDMISFAYSPCLSQIALKFGLHQSTPFSPNFALKRPTRF